MKPTPGIHHITAIAGTARQNLLFYRDLLGLRFIKKTVNFDDPTTYHLYYGDEAGNPGTILTFFPWEKMRRGRVGAGQISAVAFNVPTGALPFWAARLETAGLKSRTLERFGEHLLQLQDPDGLPLELAEIADAERMPFWHGGPVAHDEAIRGFHSATALYRHAADSTSLLTEVLGMQAAGTEGERTRYRMADATPPGLFLDIVEDPSAERGAQGTGTIHHIAFRLADHEAQQDLRRRVADVPLHVTPMIDRTYFQSIYFREAGGILFEAATDGPGFTVDEPLEALGTSLKLPPQHEPHRAEIELALPALTGDEFHHVFLPAERDDAGLVLALHGTGGDENDLLPLARKTAPGYAVLSPRGQVDENGMNRFFRRLHLNVFDEEDLVKRTSDLADFIVRRLAGAPPFQRGLVGLGYSNGANMAASLLFLHPGLLQRAVLIRPMLPLVPKVAPDLSGVPVLILAGEHDRMIPPDSTQRLIQSLTQFGADVRVLMLDAGHEMTQQDVREAAAFISAKGSAASD